MTTELIEMSPVFGLMISLLTGFGLGLAFFWGLWLTVRSLGEARHPGLRVAVSLLLRLALAVAGLLWLVRLAGLGGGLAGALGFTLARWVVARHARPRTPEREPGT
ncbi:ATP synthase subunit I [Halomonas nitroreducens]|nr:ATP synthase subunit I [Halomonas nitroreducens]